MPHLTAGLAVAALLLAALCSTCLMLIRLYRQRTLALQVQLKTSKHTIDRLRADLKDSLDWNTELRTARDEVAEIIAQDPYELEHRPTDEQRFGQLVYQFRNEPAYLPPHERGGTR